MLLILDYEVRLRELRHEMLAAERSCIGRLHALHSVELRS